MREESTAKRHGSSMNNTMMRDSKSVIEFPHVRKSYDRNCISGSLSVKDSESEIVTEHGRERALPFNSQDSQGSVMIHQIDMLKVREKLQGLPVDV
jgi:hypothetical protein